MNRPAARSRIAVLISGSGSNLQSIIDACQSGEIPADICAVIANRPGCFGLQRAAKADIPAHTVDHTAFDSREAFDQALSQVIDDSGADLLVLAGFMRILTDGFVARYQGRLLNIHPSLLPLYPGLNTHQRAIDAGDAYGGATVHFVTAELDGGPPIVQSRVAIEAGDSAEALAARVLAEEHIIYPMAVKWFCEHRLQLRDGVALLDDNPLPATGVAAWETCEHLDTPSP